MWLFFLICVKEVCMATTNERRQGFHLPITRFPHICWEPLYSVPTLRTSAHSLHESNRYHPNSNKGAATTTTTTKHRCHQVRDAGALVTMTLPSRHVLQQIRHRTGLQQTQLAHIVSVPWTDIRDLESGSRPVPLSVVEKVSRALDTHLTYNNAQ